MKLIKLNDQGFAHYLLPALVIVLIAAVGIRVMTASHAATPSSITGVGNVAQALTKHPDMVFVGNNELYKSNGTTIAKAINPSITAPVGIYAGGGGMSTTFANNGKLIFYLSEPGKASNYLYSVEPNGKKNTKITTIPVPAGSFITSIDWSESASRLAVVTGSTTAPYPSTLYTVDSSGNNLKTLYSGDDFYPPAWSPDGTKIAVGYNNTRSAVELMNADGTNQQTLPGNGGCGNINDLEGLSWTSDSQNIICSGRLGIDKINISSASFGIDTSLVRPSAFPSGTTIGGAAISPNSQQLIYSTHLSTATNGDQNCNVISINLQTNQSTNLNTIPDRDCYAVSWSPNNSQIALSEGEQITNTEPSILLVENSNGSGQKTLFTSSSYNSQPVYSLDWSVQ